MARNGHCQCIQTNHHEGNMPTAYYAEQEELDALRKIASELQGGSDRERDLGHRLWLVVNTIAGKPAGVEN